MARLISQLTANGATSGTDLFWIEQNGLPRKITLTDLAAATAGTPAYQLNNNQFLQGENLAGGTFYDLIGINTSDWVEIGEPTRNVQYDGTLHKFSSTAEHYAPAGGQTHLIRSTTNWTTGTLFLPGVRWQENDGTSHAGIRAYTTTGLNSFLVLGTGWLDAKLTLASSNAHTMTGDLTLTGTLAANTVTGVNVTSGVDPGHTHSVYLTGESDTLALVTGRGSTTVTNCTFSGGLNLSNANITGVGALTFSDPGPSEGIAWTGGNWAVWESPNDLVTNTAGNLQFVGNSVRRMTLDTSGNLDITGTVSASNIPAYNVFTGGAIVTRHSSGYIFTNYLNMTADYTTGSPTGVAVETSSDKYVRWQTPANFFNELTPRYARELGAADNLNSLVAAQAGCYYQTANADTTGNNYPSNEAGSLIVQKSAGNATQLYITYPESSNKMFFRSYYNTAFGAWKEVATRNEAQTFTGALTLSSNRLNGTGTLDVYGDGSSRNLSMTSTSTTIGSGSSAIIYNSGSLSSSQMGNMRHLYHTGTLYPTGFATMVHVNTTTTSFTTLASIDNFWHRKFRFTGTTNTTITLTNDSTVPDGSVMWLAGYGGTITIQQGTGVTLYFYDGAGGTLKTGTRTIAKTGWATLHRISSTAYEICGIGVS